MNRLAASFLALLAGLLIAACGGSEELSKGKLVSRGDKICKDTLAKLEKIDPPKSQSELGGVAKEAAKVIEPANEKIQDLKAKDSKVQKDLKLVQKAFARQVKVFNAGKGGNRAKLESASKAGEKDFRDGRAAARRIGFKECGQA